MTVVIRHFRKEQSSDVRPTVKNIITQHDLFFSKKNLKEMCRMCLCRKAEFVQNITDALLNSHFKAAMTN